MPADPTPDYVLANRAAWDEWSAAYYESDRQWWNDDAPSWGIFGIPDSEVGILPDVAGRYVIELGCGGAYVSAWMARRGGSVVGIDNSPGQLANARRFQGQFDLQFSDPRDRRTAPVQGRDVRRGRF